MKTVFTFLTIQLFLFWILFFSSTTLTNAADAQIKLSDSGAYTTQPVINSATGQNRTGFIVVEISNTPPITYTEVNLTVEFNPNILDVREYDGGGSSYQTVVGTNTVQITLDPSSYGGSLTPTSDPYTIGVFSYTAKAVGTSDIKLTSYSLIDNDGQPVNITNIEDGSITYSSYFANEVEPVIPTTRPTATPVATQPAGQYVPEVQPRINVLPQTSLDSKSISGDTLIKNGIIIILISTSISIVGFKYGHNNKREWKS